jgi:hypothetical protein
MNNLRVTELIVKLQPHYDELNKRFSKSYLSGSSWYVGDDLLKWWEMNCLRRYNQSILKLKYITWIVMEDYKNKIRHNDSTSNQ